MTEGKSRFALFYGNRVFFPGALMAAAREETVRVLTALGHETLLLDAEATRFGAVETVAEGKRYAAFLKANAGKFDGVILFLPNFGDENGAVAALKDAGVPILVQAYPDELDKMSVDFRRDSFCGKISIMDVFYQNRIKFTALKPHTVAPTSKAFAANVDHFDRVCRVVKALKNMVVGAIGARTTAFKTVRVDELTLQRHGITVETFDLSDVFGRMNSLSKNNAAFKAKARALKAYTDFSHVPAEAFTRLTQLAVVLDQLREECGLDAIAMRCWLELQQQMGITACVLLSELNERHLTAACEVDVGNAVMMHALRSASGEASACLDWNNNYGDDENKCILFHCGPVPQSMMTARGEVVDNILLAKAVGTGCSYGCNVGRIKPMPMTFGSLMTDAGKLKYFVGEGEFTADPIAREFFGCAGVAAIPNLQDVLLHLGRNGHRHHVSVTPGHSLAAVVEALGYYLGGDVSAFAAADPAPRPRPRRR
jgi:L-fucose isomerase-like protein